MGVWRLSQWTTREVPDKVAFEQIFEEAKQQAVQVRGGKSISGSTKAQVESILRMCEKQKGAQSSWKREGEKSRKWGLKDGGETHHGGLVSFV